MKDKIVELIESSDMQKFQKLMAKGFIERAKEDEENNKADRSLVEKVANEKKHFEIILSNVEVIIYKVTGKEKWDVEYPYRVIYEDKDGQWCKAQEVSPSFDIAFLIYLERKYLGLNSQFTLFATKMLDIKRY